MKKVFVWSKKGPVRESNPGPLAPEARIIPLDHEASKCLQLAPTIKVGVVYPV